MVLTSYNLKHEVNILILSRLLRYSLGRWGLLNVVGAGLPLETFCKCFAWVKWFGDTAFGCDRGPVPFLIVWTPPPQQALIM